MPQLSNVIKKQEYWKNHIFPNFLRHFSHIVRFDSLLLQSIYNYFQKLHCFIHDKLWKVGILTLEEKPQTLGANQKMPYSRKGWKA